MKRFACSVVFIALIGLTLSFVGANSASAKPAETLKGPGCFVRSGDGEFDYVWDETCSAHLVYKVNEDGELVFYSYQDHGQTSWRPARPYRNTSTEHCFDLGGTIGVACGTLKESVTPSGEYKSSFQVR